MVNYQAEERKQNLSPSNEEEEEEEENLSQKLSQGLSIAESGEEEYRDLFVRNIIEMSE